MAILNSRSDAASRKGRTCEAVDRRSLKWFAWLESCERNDNRGSQFSDGDWLRDHESPNNHYLDISPAKVISTRDWVNIDADKGVVLATEKR